MVSLRHPERRHALDLAAAAILIVLIAAPFTAPFSACNPTMVFSVSGYGSGGPHLPAQVVTATTADRGTHPDGSVLTEEQLKDDATFPDVSMTEALVATIAFEAPRGAFVGVSRAIPLVLRL